MEKEYVSEFNGIKVGETVVGKYREGLFEVVSIRTFITMGRTLSAEYLVRRTFKRNGKPTADATIFELTYPMKAKPFLEKRVKKMQLDIDRLQSLLNKL